MDVKSSFLMIFILLPIPSISREKPFPLSVSESVRLKKVVFIPGGSFMMGNPSSMKMQGESYMWPHKVSVDSFYMDEIPITYGDFEHYVRSGGMKPKYWDYALYNKKNLPVTGINWYHAVDYCNWRSIAEGLVPAYYKTDKIDAWGYVIWELKSSSNGYRLPTEAEFEYAARGGLEGKNFPWGDAFFTSWANCDLKCGIDGGTWPRLAGVYSQKSNTYGLYGMSGNIWHWIDDWYSADCFSSKKHDNPQGPRRRRTKVLRGGSWGSIDVRDLTVSKRSFTAPSNYTYDIGFRCVRSAKICGVCKRHKSYQKHHFYNEEKQFFAQARQVNSVYSKGFINRLGSFIRDYYPHCIYFQTPVDQQPVITPMQLAHLIVEVSQKFSLNPLFLVGIMASESGFGSVAVPRWYNNPMAYHWQSRLMKYGAPVYYDKLNYNRKYKNLRQGFYVFARGIRKKIYIEAARKNLDAFHLIYVGYRADEWMGTIAKVYKDIMGISFNKNIPEKNAGAFIYTNWEKM